MQQGYHELSKQSCTIIPDQHCYIYRLQTLSYEFTTIHPTPSARLTLYQRRVKRPLCRAIIFIHCKHIRNILAIEFAAIHSAYKQQIYNQKFQIQRQFINRRVKKKWDTGLFWLSSTKGRIVSPNHLQLCKSDVIYILQQQHKTLHDCRQQNLAVSTSHKGSFHSSMNNVLLSNSTKRQLCHFYSSASLDFWLLKFGRKFFILLLLN